MAEKTPLRLACNRYAECVGSCPYDMHDLYEPWEESCSEKCSVFIDYAECWEKYFIQQSEKGHLMDNNNESTELYYGGTAEDWHNAYSNLVRGKELIDSELYKNARRVEGETKNQRDAKEHWKMKCKSLVACLENDYGLDASWDGLRKFWSIERVRPKLGSAKPDEKGRLWIDEADYNDLVDAKDERDRLRAEVMKLGEQLDRLRGCGDA